MIKRGKVFIRLGLVLFVLLFSVSMIYGAATEKINFQGQSDGVWAWGDNSFGQLPETPRVLIMCRCSPISTMLSPLLLARSIR